MIYVTGDGFAAASYAASPYAYARQDKNQFLKGLAPHPKNLDVSFATHISEVLHQPLRMAASYSTCYLKIIRDLLDTLEKTKIEYVVVTWPDFYRGEVFDGERYHQFEFKYAQEQLSEKLLPMAQEYMNLWKHQMVIDEFISFSKTLCYILEERQIKYSFVMSSITVPGINYGRWLLDPNTTTINDWAKKFDLINSYGFLTPQGHVETTILLAAHLTNQ